MRVDGRIRAGKIQKRFPEISYVPQNLEGQSFVNDLERPVFEKFVFLAQLKTWLLKQPEVSAALMSGSGSTVFGVLKEKIAGDSLAGRVRKELDREIWVCASETALILAERTRLACKASPARDFRRHRRNESGQKAKFAIARARSPAREARAQDYSPALRFRVAREYSRFSFAIKLALISAGQTASHS